MSADAAHLLATYAKAHGAGAFATPTRAELEAHPERLSDWGHTVAVGHQLSPHGARFRDFTGRNVRLPGGARVLSHLARAADAPLPDLSEWDYVHAFATDLALSQELAAQGRAVWATRITAASAMIHCWWRRGRTYPAHDAATVVQLPRRVAPELARSCVAELRALSGWADDAPYYNRDGSWSSLALRGFDPSPQVSVKPSEMSAAWQEAHPELAGARCDWTDLAARCPALVQVVGRVPGGRQPERVRLLRMAAPRGSRPSQLDRHCDITDRAAGTRDGQIARFHVPLISAPGCTLTAWSLDGVARRYHLAPFRVFYLDQRKPHAVTNASPVDRVHLVIDVVVTPAVRRTIAAAYREDPWTRPTSA